jgi:ribose transport system permease protein
MSTQEAPVIPTAPPAPTRRTAGDTLANVGERFGLVVVLLATFVFFSAAEPDTFPTDGNVQSILNSNSVLAMLAVATVIPFVVGQFDLSLAAILGLSSLLAGTLMSDHGFALVPAALVAVAAGGAVGLVNGLVVAKVGVNSIITTLGTASILAGLVQWISDGETVATGLSPGLLEFGAAEWLGQPRVVFCVIAVALIVGYLLRQTPFGRSLQAVGTNERAATLVGLPVARLSILAFVIGGAIAGLAGLVQLGVAGSANPNFGPNLLLPSLTAVFLGATTIRPGQYNVLGTLIAVVFVATSISGLALMGAPAWVQPVYTGVTLVLAVALSTLIRRRRSGA